MFMLLCLLLLGDTVENGPTPEKKSDVSLTLDLTIGGDDAEDEAIFSGTTTVATGSDGRIYVNDPGNFRVAMFASDGSLIKTFGREGAGPGEFNEPVALTVNANDEVYVFDTGHKKVARFDADGNFICEVRFNPSIQGVDYPSVSPSGVIAMTTYISRNEDWMRELALYDEDLKLIKILGAATYESSDNSQFNQPGFWVDVLRFNFQLALSGIPYATSFGDGFFMYSNNAYSGELINTKGDIQTKMTREFKPRPFNEQARFMFCEQLWQDLRANPFLTERLTKPIFERALNKTEFPPALAPMAATARFRDGLAVMSGYDISKQEGIVDFYDKDLRFIGTTAFQGPFKYFYGDKNHLFTVGFDADDAVVVQRYTVSGL